MSRLYISHDRQAGTLRWDVQPRIVRGAWLPPRRDRQRPYRVRALSAEERRALHRVGIDVPAGGCIRVEISDVPR